MGAAGRILDCTSGWQRLSSTERFSHGRTTLSGPLLVRIYTQEFRLDGEEWFNVWLEDHERIAAWLELQGMRADLVPFEGTSNAAACLVVRFFRRKHEAMFKLLF